MASFCVLQKKNRDGYDDEQLVKIDKDYCNPSIYDLERVRLVV